MQYVYLNGEFVESDKAGVSVFDHGVLYGDGVFEGIRAYGGRVFRLDEHIDRIFAAAKAIALEIPMTKAELGAVVVATCKKNGLTDCYIRLVITRGKGNLGISPINCEKTTVFCIAAGIKLYTDEQYEKGMSVITSVQRRNKATIVDPQIKSLNYLNNILAKIEANRAGAAEAIMLNHDGIVTEATGDNIFIVKNGEILTPPVYVGILDGITRRTVIEAAKKEGIPVRETEFTLFNVYNADECFLTGTAAEAIAVTSVDGRTIGSGVQGEVTKRILAAFRRAAHDPALGTEIK